MIDLGAVPALGLVEWALSARPGILASFRRLPKKIEEQVCRRLEADSPIKEVPLRRGPEGPHYPNGAFSAACYAFTHISFLKLVQAAV
jgi:hypothetical protein